tara:strand:+ start:1198 stop:1359 length:162 start_codon:yes stop_codon:yes gene_type:complete
LVVVVPVVVEFIESVVVAVLADYFQIVVIYQGQVLIQQHIDRTHMWYLLDHTL